MWCGKCQADVAAEVSPDNQRVFCTICGALLSTIDLPPTRPITEKLGDRTKDARELLKRWSSGQVLDPFGPIPKTLTPPSLPVPLSDPIPISSATTKESAALVSVSAPVFVAAEATIPNVPDVERPSLPEVTRDLVTERPLPPIQNPLAAAIEPSRSFVAPNLNPLVAPPDATPPVSPIISAPLIAVAPTHNFHRVDAAHPTDHFASAKKAMTPTEEAMGPFGAKPTVNETKREPRRPMLWFPTWDPAVWRSESNSTGSWSSMAGQFLAYTGVLGLTAGTCLVVWSYFGGPANYAPMGWLLATAGQMLLFFGVVTLVSGGLEQTTEQVNKRIEQLGDHIIRIEQAAREISLRGAVPPAHFGLDHDSAVPPRSAASGYERSVVEEQSGR
ncbi:MAG: hypothetical protein IAG10_32020 [Planctomycetaceae bacterium]|nr:hypothetical protein [Planctomycetaceae bacterium]